MCCTYSYVVIHEQTGNYIDAYNIQYYNQGVGQYMTYEEIFKKGKGMYVRKCSVYLFVVSLPVA